MGGVLIYIVVAVLFTLELDDESVGETVLPFVSSLDIDLEFSGMGSRICLLGWCFCHPRMI